MMTPPPLPEMAGPMPFAQPPPDLYRAWSEAHQMSAPMHGQDMKTPDSWAAEFGNAPPTALPAPLAAMNASQRQELFQNPYMSSGMYGMRPMGSFPMTMGSAQMPSMDKGKGKSREIDFEAAFAQMAETLESTRQSSAKIEELDDTVDLAAAMAATKMESDHGGSATEEDFTAGLEPDFKRVWESLQDSQIPPAQEDMARWEAEYNQLMASTRDDEYGQAMQGAWSDATANESSIKFDDEGLPTLGDYVFGTWT